MIVIRSVWQENLHFPTFSRLKGERRAEVAVVGGGMAGLLCAYLLGREGVKTVVVERGSICHGTTAGTTGKITVGHGLIYSKISEDRGDFAAEGYYLANKLACNEIKKLAARIDCDFEPRDNYIYSRDNAHEIERELAVLSRIGARAEFRRVDTLPFETVGGVCYPDQAQFNPLKLLAAISKRLEIYENSPALEIEDGVVRCPDGCVRADTIIVATHFPIIDRYGGYFLKLYQSRSHVVALEGGADLSGMYMDACGKGYSFRNYKNMLLIGGGARRTGKGCGGEELREFVKSHYADAKVKYEWAAQDCMSLDGVPYIGEYSSSAQNMLVATGFNKWGISGSMVSAMLLTDRAVGRKNAYAEIFRTDRSILKPQLFANAGETLMNFLCPRLRRCSHLGCALKWNPDEHTWDCPCHGSRFDEGGEVIEAPATKNIKPKS